MSTDISSWDEIYDKNEPEALGWFESRPATLDALVELAPDIDAGILDVGAGASTLIDHLLDAGYHDVTLVDLSDVGLSVTRDRLGSRHEDVTFVVADITSFESDRTWDVWHDRATFHFLTDEGDRNNYRAALDAALGDDGVAVIATFAPDGPERCAGRDVAQYDEQTLAAEFADSLECLGCRRSAIVDEASDRRPYTICRFRRLAA